MANKKIKIQTLIEAIKTAHGMKTGVCEILGISRPTLERYINDNKEVAEAFAFIKIRRYDRAEYKLDEAIERGELQAIFFALKNSNRGYSDKLDVTSNGETILTWKKIIEDAKTNKPKTSNNES